MAAKVPRCATGTTGTPCSWARNAAPIRKLPDPAVLGAGALREDHQRPAVGQHLTGRGRHRAAAAVDREGVEEQRGADRAPPGVEEVVRRGRHPGLAPPLVGQREQDQRGVEVRGVVGREDHRPLDPVEDVEPLDLGPHLRAEQRLEAGLLDDLAHGHRRPLARPVAAGRRSASPAARTARPSAAPGSGVPSASRGRYAGRRRRRRGSGSSQDHRTSASRCGGLCR